MAVTSSSRRPVTYFIVYGFLGGPFQSRKLRRLLRSHGYSPARRAEEADIVIAHSGGAYVFAAGIRTKLIVLAAPALTRKKPHRVFKQTSRQLWRAARAERYLAQRSLWSLYGVWCALRNPRRNYRMIRLASDTSSELPKFAGAAVLFIANRADTWSSGPQLDRLLVERPWAFMSLAGAHEHIWAHPEEYVAIMNQYAARLLA